MPVCIVYMCMYTHTHVYIYMCICIYIVDMCVCVWIGVCMLMCDVYEVEYVWSYVNIYVYKQDVFLLYINKFPVIVSYAMASQWVQICTYLASIVFYVIYFSLFSFN